MRAFAQQRDRRIRNRANACELVAEGVEFGGLGQVAVPQQPGGLFECRVLRQFVDQVAGDDELAAFPVDLAQFRGRRDDAF